MSEILLNKWLEAGVQTSLSIIVIRKLILVWPTCRTPAVGKVCVSECVSKSVCVSEDRSPYCSAHDEWLIMKLGMHVGYHDANKVSNVYSDPVTELYGQYRLVLCCAVLRVRRTISVTLSLVVRLLLRDHAQAAGVWDNEVVNILQCNQMAIPA